MITSSFDIESPAIIMPPQKADAPALDAVIITFSYLIEEYAKRKYNCRQVAMLSAASGETGIYQLDYQGKKIGLYKTNIGAPATAAFIEEMLGEVRTDKILMYGGAGCLDKEISKGKIMIPYAAYRDEGTSYHYAPAADYIEIKNWQIVAEFMEQEKLPYITGKTWTTDGFYRETRKNFEARKNDGCIAVEMECAAAQAVCDFRQVQFYNFLKGGDMLDAPEWDSRAEFGNNQGSQHDPRYFEIALKLAGYIAARDCGN